MSDLAPPSKNKGGRPRGTTSSVKIIDASADIAAREPNLDEVGFGAKCLVSASLPYRNPKPEQLVNGAWIRRNGNYTLWVQGGINGIPFGTYPRLFVMWLTAEAIRTGSRKIHTGGSFSEFCRKLNIDRSRGKNGAGKRLIEQADRLLQSRAAFVTGGISDTSKLKSTDFLNFADKYTLFFDPDERASDQGSLFESEIILTENFFNEITTHCIPVDMRAVLSLQQSPLELDIYQWLAYRTYSLTRSGKTNPSFPTWQQLFNQFGSTYGRLRDFKDAFKDALESVMRVYPGLKVSPTDNGLMIAPSPSAVPPRQADLLLAPKK